MAEPIQLIALDAELLEELKRSLREPPPTLQVVESPGAFFETLQTARTPRGVIVVDDAEALDPRWLREARRRNEAVQLLVVARQCSDETWRRLILCGAAGVLRPPLDGIDLAGDLAAEPVVTNLFRRHDTVRRHGKVMIRYSVPSNTEYVTGVVHMVSLLAMEFGFPVSDYTMNLPLAVDEAMTNAIVHGNGNSPHKTVEIEAMIDSQLLRLKITDQGRGFRTAQARNPLEPENLMTPNGRGVYLIQQVMDEVQWTRDGCCIEMVRRNPQR